MYTRSGPISGGALASNAEFTLATHTVTEDVTGALLEMTLVWARSTTYDRSIRFWINGSRYVSDEYDYAPGGGEATISLVTDLAEGDVVDFVADASHADARQYTSGSWSIFGEIARIEVAPQPPTFHADHTITLPEQTGVTYSVDGDPAPGATVTVTATADPGYTLTGQSEWQHTYPEPSSGGSLYIGDTPVDRVYVGAQLAQALYHGPTLLWGIHGTITPDPPTFLEEDPWITLPTVEHVTYQVSGTPGAGQSVTVTAVPDEGWVLDGDTTWAHEWESDINPYELGAIHWLPFNDDPLEDIGTAPATWRESNSPTISDGALVSGVVAKSADSTYDPTNGSSVTGWVRNTSTSINYGNPPLSATASFSEITFWANSAGAARWRFRRGGTGAQTIIAGTVPDEWAFIAACMEPVSGTTWRYRAYINGTEVLNNTYNAGTQSNVTFNNVLFDAGRADVSDAAIYNHVLTATEIADLHDAGRTT